MSHVTNCIFAEHGGEVNYKYRLSNNYVLTKYGRPSYFLRYRISTPSQSTGPSPSSSRPLSRISSLESMRDAFYSAAGTPRSLNSQSPTVSHTNLQGYKQKHPTWLDMTLSSAPASRVDLPRLHANGLQLASPMMSPKQSTQNLNAAPPASGIRASQDENGQMALEERYYEDEESDEGTARAQEDSWDKKSLISDASDTADTVVPSPGRNSRSTSSRNSPVTPTEYTRASSLARLRTQLQANDPNHVAPIRGQSSGTLVSFEAFAD